MATLHISDEVIPGARSARRFFGGHARRRSLRGRDQYWRRESHEYKIHLGSGNILMESGSRYLCIVPGGGDSAASVPLPFEGDSMLAIILSKAILLANDKAIKDPMILGQIRAR